MQHASIRYAALLAACSLFAINGYSQNAGKGSWTKEKAAQWMKSGIWKNGLTIKAHPSVNAVEFAEQYNRNKPLWDKVFSFLNRKDLDTLSPGTYPVDGKKAYAMVGHFNTKDLDKVKWESHRKYIDLQYIIQGKEKIGVAPVSGAKEVEPYDEAKDIAFYKTAGQFYIARPGVFFLFFPQETHRPDVKVNETMPVKKLVIKISVAG